MVVAFAKLSFFSRSLSTTCNYSASRVRLFLTPASLSFGAPWWRRVAIRRKYTHRHTHAHTLERHCKYLHAEVPGSPLIIHQVLVRGGLQAMLVPDEALGALELEAFLRVGGERAARRR